MRIVRLSFVFVLVAILVQTASAVSQTPGERELKRLMEKPRGGGASEAILGAIGRKAWSSEALFGLTGRWVFQRTMVPEWTSLAVHRAGTIAVTAVDLNRFRELGVEVRSIGSINLDTEGGAINSKEEIVVFQILDLSRLEQELVRMLESDDQLRKTLSEEGMRVVTATAEWQKADITRALKSATVKGSWKRVDDLVSLTFKSKETGTKNIAVSPGTILAYQYSCFCWNKSGDVKIVRDTDQRVLCPLGYREPGPPPRQRAVAVSPVCPPRRLDPEREQLITKQIERMDGPALVGQVLAVGYAKVGERNAANRQFSNERLVELVRSHQIGTALIYGFNLPPAAATDEEVLSSVVGLTTALQRAAAESQRLPLLVAIDQEGGFESRITRGVTRMPSPIFFGAARDAPLAERAAEAVGSELRALGVNMVFAPIADINTNYAEDIIGRRAFSSERDIVAHLSRAWAKGLRTGGVLPVAKHYPGHGDATTDPHYGVSRIKYASPKELLDYDMVPFRDLACEDIAGIMTSHMLTPLDQERQVTISPTAVGYLRNDLHYDGVVISDDIVDMMGALMSPQGRVIRTHEEVAIQALLAGHDIIVFGCISDRELPENPERTMTEEEFDAVFSKLVTHFLQDPDDLQKLREHVRRVLRAKMAVCGSDDSETCGASFEPARFRAEVEKHRPIALDVARASAILISENGHAVGQIGDSKYFRPGKGPLNAGQAISDNDHVVIVSPVHYPPDALVDAVKRDWITADRLHIVPVLYGFSYDDRKWAIDAWQQEAPVYSKTLKSGERVWYDDAINATVNDIVKAAEPARAVVMGVMNDEHIRMLERVCKALGETDKQIIVLLYKEPYFLPRTIYEQRNVSVLYLSPLPSGSVGAELLFGHKSPKGAYDLPVPLVDIVNHPRPMQ